MCPGGLMSDQSHLTFRDWQEVIHCSGEGQLLLVHRSGSQLGLPLLCLSFPV